MKPMALTVPGVALLAVVVVGATASMAAWSPWLGMALSGSALIAGLLGFFYRRLPGIYLVGLGSGLVGYAFLGRGFAYLGYPPVYVGEVLLVFGITTALLRGRIAYVTSNPLAWPILALMAIGTAGTVPYVATYGLDALRDAVLWAYAVFAIVVASLLRDSSTAMAVLRRYRALVPAFLVFIVGMRVANLLWDLRIPPTPFSDVPIVFLKGGDVAVHLAGILAFLMLGLHRSLSSDQRDSARWRIGEWPLWALWLAGVLTVLPGRAAMLTLVAVAAYLLLLRPTVRWVRLTALAVLLSIAATIVDAEFDVGRGRSLSPGGVVVAFLSIFDTVDTAGTDLSGTRSWRLRWWQDIVQYTVSGEYFWTGKGYGINLANADGYQVWEDESLRSPHNGHITVLARSGVPGAFAWLAVHVVLCASLLRAAARRRSEGRDGWARINLWIGAYWIAFVVNGTFDVFFEGPQGGIWFWSLAGFALAWLRIQEPNGGSATAASGGDANPSGPGRTVAEPNGAPRDALDRSIAEAQ